MSTLDSTCVKYYLTYCVLLHPCYCPSFKKTLLFSDIIPPTSFLNVPLVFHARLSFIRDTESG